MRIAGQGNGEGPDEEESGNRMTVPILDRFSTAFSS
jgi:hypothetical protein